MYTTSNGIKLTGEEGTARMVLSQGQPCVGRDEQGKWYSLSLDGRRIVATPEQFEPTHITESPYDFDSGGFGIGGLGRYEEKPIIPSVKAIERMERMQARATYCRRCGQSDVFDGAMFTTLGGSNICDDCV